MKKIFTLFAAMAMEALSYAQLPDGSIAPDFSLYEINKTTGQMITSQTINLYSMLNDYKTVYIDVSATTSALCYNFHQTGTLESIYNNYGPNSTVNDSRVLFIEGMGNSWSVINGSASSAYWDCTHIYGSTTEQVPYPVIPLHISPNFVSGDNSCNYYTFNTGYDISSFPTTYMICPNRMIFGLDHLGGDESATYHGYISSKCPAWNNNNDAALGTDRITNGVYFCELNFQPQIMIQNLSPVTMTSATLQVTHGTDVQTMSWTGNLAQFETELVTLPAIIGTQNGQHTLTVQILNVNGQIDEGPMYNTHTENFNAQITSDTNTATQDFSSSDLGSWTVVDNTGGDFGIYAGALRFRAWNLYSGTTGECYAPLMNFSNISAPSFPSLKFDVAHRRYQSSNDKLQVKVSIDCGTTWITAWEKSGAALATVNTGSGEFQASSSQYRTENVDLSDYMGYDHVIIKFVFTSDYGNNIFVDNIQIEKIVPTYDISVTTLPATDLTESSVTLNGTVSPDGATVTEMGFQYRIIGDTNYTTVGASGTTNLFSQSLYGLPVNTIYEYRAYINIAENSETYYGTIQTFEVSWMNNDTIRIYNSDMLQWVANRCNSGSDFEGKYIKLMNNIVLPLNQPNNMTSIGSYPYYPFKGTFDGNGMLISNLYIDHPNTEYQGFFGYTLNANLYKVGLVNITASGRNYTGGMVAYAQNTYMRDCYVNGGTLFALSYCGGLVGYQQQGTNSIISGCYNTCTVSGNHYVGGLVGYSNYATVRNSYVAANVTGQGNAIGAIIGGANEVLMYNCYFSTSITGQTNAIGENNFKDNEGLTNEQMQNQQFVATLNQGLVTPVWKADYATPINNGFPILIWQYSNAETCEAPTNLSFTVNGNTATLTWDGGDNASYFVVEYGVTGGNTQTENTSSHQYVIHNMQNANYFWRVKSICSFGESNFVNGNNIISGITNHNNEQMLQLYPNPTKDLVNVQLTINNEQLEDVGIQVFDVYGRLLEVVNMADVRGASLQTTQIDLSRYAKGVYFVKAVSEGKVIAVRKVVKR